MNPAATWYLNRGTGIVLLVLFTLTLVLGITATAGRGPRWFPGFVTQGLHRSLSLLSTLLLVGHVSSAVLDDYVDINWIDAVRPFGGSYRPLYLGLGALAVDLLVVLLITSLLRRRMPDPVWRVLHLLAYPLWGVSVVHTVGIGTDMTSPALRWLVAGCIGVVAATLVVRGVARLSVGRA